MRKSTILRAALCAAALVAPATVLAHSTKAALNGPNVITASADGTAIWQFPDKRALDPAIFGTPKAPLNTDLLPLKMRATNAARTAYTTTAKPGPFSNNIKMITGNVTISSDDRTPLDGPGSKDRVALRAEFDGPQGQTYLVVMNKVIPKGPDHNFFGGVGTNMLMHGNTGIGTPLVTTEFSYITAWGVGDLYIDGEKTDTNRIVHVMVSERTRDEAFKVGFGVARPKDLEVHVILPPRKVSPNGPVKSPVPTGVTLPNGMEQPFIHVNFYGNARMTGNPLWNS